MTFNFAKELCPEKLPDYALLSQRPILGAKVFIALVAFYVEIIRNTLIYTNARKVGQYA